LPIELQIENFASSSTTQFERIIRRRLKTPRSKTLVIGSLFHLPIPTGRGDILSNEKTALAIRRVVHTELEACATAINRKDQKVALDQLSEATARLKRLASELIRQFG
jgi:hypothetical protein